MLLEMVPPIVCCMLLFPGIGDWGTAEIVFVLLVIAAVRNAVSLPVAEVVQIGFHVAQVQLASAGPVVDDASDGLEAVSVAVAVACREAVSDEEVAVNEFVKERRDEEAPTVFRIGEDWCRQSDEGLVSALV